MRHIFIKAYRINMRFTHFQVTFQQAGIQYIPRVSLRGRRANAHLLAMFIPIWRRVRTARLLFQHGVGSGALVRPD